MAGRFGVLGAWVAVTSTGGVGSPVQPTTAAVNTVRTSTTTAGAALAGRMRATETKVAIGAGKHAAQEARSAAALSALSPPTVVV